MRRLRSWLATRGGEGGSGGHEHGRELLDGRLIEQGCAIPGGKSCRGGCETIGKFLGETVGVKGINLLEAIVHDCSIQQARTHRGWNGRQANFVA